MSIDHFFHKRYDRDRYNCAHFVCDVWEHEAGVRIDEALDCFLKPVKERRARQSLRAAFEKLERPESPCIVLMQRKKSTPHVGVFLRGRVLHIHELGVEFQPLDVVSRAFDKVGFYK